VIDDLLTNSDILLAWFVDHRWQVLAVVVATELAIVLAHFALLRWRHQRWADGARCVEILAPPLAAMPGAEALWGNLIGLLRPAWKRLILGQPHLTFEYLFGIDGVRIRLWVPGAVPQHLVERAIEAAWPSARTTVHQPDSPVPLDGRSTGGQFALARSEWLPIRHDQPTDPLRAVLGAAAGMPSWQHAAVQILARPATGRRLSGTLGSTSVALLRALLDLVTPGPPPAAHSYGQSPLTRVTESAEARAMHGKAHRSRYEVAIRYAVQADTPTREQDDRRNAIRGRAHAIAAAFALYSGHNRFERHRMFRPAARLAGRRMARGFLLSVPELAAIAHIPLDAAVPGLQRAGANTVPPSPKVSTGGPYAKLLGVADAGHERPVALRVADSFHHVHVLGPNGTGKSTLLAQMILSDIEAGRGVVVIEAKGDLVRDLLGLMPEQSAGKVVLIDPDDRHPRPSLNVLRGPDAAMGVDNLVGIFHQIYADSWGPRTDDILRGCALTLARTGGTLADVPKLLSSTAFRQTRVAAVKDPLLKGFWSWYDALSEQTQAHVTAPIMNKLRAFLLRPFVRDVLGATDSTFDLSRVLDGGVLLVRLPKGVLGDDTARLMGSMVLAQVWQAAAHRAKIGRSRAPAAIYVDECHNFLTLPHAMADILAEARAYRLSLTLAHQHLAQLPRDLRQAISSDARNKIYFSLSPEDAREAERHFAPHLTAHDLANLDAYQAAARLVVQSAEAPPFTLRTQPLPDPCPDLARRIRAVAAQAHGRTGNAAPPLPDHRRSTTN
jgi:hypothetical protein